MVKQRQMEYLVENNLMFKYQSAYRTAHWTDTTLSRVLSDIYMAVDNGNVSLLVLLNLSSAFDNDSSLSVTYHVAYLCCSAIWGTMEPFVTFWWWMPQQHLVQSLVLSRLKYYNSLLVGISKNNINRLQKIQNTVARIATKSHVIRHISPVLWSLH